MRTSAVLAVLALALAWATSLWLWPGLPESIPMHFDFYGRPDRFVDRSLANWLFLPAIATAMVGLLAFALPRWIRPLARDNSALFNVPNKREFAALSSEARLRAIRPLLILLRVVAPELALLFLAIRLGCARVASGAWQTLPPALIWLSVAILAGTALGSIPFGIASMRREFARARG